MLKFDDRGNVLLDYRGRDKNQINTQHEGIGLLSSIIDSDCKILYEASDIALMRTVDGSKICGYMDDKETGVNYLYVCRGYGVGLTPLLDSEGKPIITK